MQQECFQILNLCVPLVQRDFKVLSSNDAKHWKYGTFSTIDKQSQGASCIPWERQRESHHSAVCAAVRICIDSDECIQPRENQSDKSTWKTRSLWPTWWRAAGWEWQWQEKTEEEEKEECGWDSQPWPRSLSVNTVTRVRAAPGRFIWSAQRHTDGPIAETELLCDYGKDGGKKFLSWS